MLKNTTKYIFLLFLLFAYFFPLYISLKAIVEGSIPFWYDSARDLLQALDNLKKITLIGPTGGIPGIFYGPHWIWLQSLPLIFTRDPRFVALMVLVVPYFVLFAFLFYKLSKPFGRVNTVLLWLLFMYGYRQYSIYLWQPHLAPVLLLAAVYFLIRGKLLIFGIVLGLLLNFHISFGVGVVVGTLLYLILEKRKISVFLAGFLPIFIPSILFEFRHDFLQTKAIWRVLEQGILYNKAVVDQVGLSQGDILHQFFLSVPASLLSLSPILIFVIYFLLLLSVVFNFLFKWHKLNEVEAKVVRYLLSVSGGILLVYLSTRNPVWAYHFVGVETVWLLLLGILIKRIRLSEKIVFVLIVLVTGAYILKYQKESKVPSLSISSLSTKQYIVDQIFEDSSKTPFAYQAYSPSVYTYDYDYLFGWRGREKYGFVPEKEVGNTDLVYLIVPNETEVVREDFTNHKTPNKIYKTEKSWKIEDGTVVIKRVKK